MTPTRNLSFHNPPRLTVHGSNEAYSQLLFKFDRCPHQYETDISLPCTYLIKDCNGVTRRATYHTDVLVGADERSMQRSD